MILNYKDYALFKYKQAQEETLDPFVLGHVVINDSNEIGVVIQRHGGNEYRTDMFGNCSINEIREATREEIERFRPQLSKLKIMSRKLEQYGVILSTDEVGNEQIQRIDNAEQWMIDNEVEYVQQLNSDGEAEQIVRELVIDNYIETIHQDLMQGDKSLLYGLLSGEGLVPICHLSEQELIEEAKELDIL